MANGKSLILNQNVESRKKLVGIAQNIATMALSYALSAGTELLSTEQEVRDTLQVNVLIPFLVDVETVESVLTQVTTTGAVIPIEAPLAERILKLPNQLITKPILYRPRDAEVLKASELLGRYQTGFVTSGYVARDRAYFKSISSQIVAGVVGQKSEVILAPIVPSVDLPKEALDFTNIIRTEVARLIAFKDKVIQYIIPTQNVAIVVSAEAMVLIKDDAKYNVRTDIAEKSVKILLKSGGIVPTGNFDGSPVYLSKQLPEHCRAIIMVKGSATSAFSLRDYMNYDKVPGVQAYKASMEFDEGTGVWFPQLISWISSDATAGTGHAAQSAVGFGDYDMDAVLTASITTGTNPT